MRKICLGAMLMMVAFQGYSAPVCNTIGQMPCDTSLSRCGMGILNRFVPQAHVAAERAALAGRLATRDELNEAEMCTSMDNNKCTFFNESTPVDVGTIRVYGGKTWKCEKRGSRPANWFLESPTTLGSRCYGFGYFSNAECNAQSECTTMKVIGPSSAVNDTGFDTWITQNSNVLGLISFSGGYTEIFGYCAGIDHCPKPGNALSPGAKREEKISFQGRFLKCTLSPHMFGRVRYHDVTICTNLLRKWQSGENTYNGLKKPKQQAQLAAELNALRSRMQAMFCDVTGTRQL